MIVAVTGAKGLIGARTLAALRAAGHEVRALTRTPAAPDERRFVLGEPPAPGALEGADALIHGAHDFSVLGWEQAQRVNVSGSFQLLDAAAKAGVKRVMFVSSVSAFPGCRSDYGRGKLLVEGAVLSAGGTVVRPGLTYGGPGGMFGALARLCRLPVLPVFDGGRQPLWLVRVDEVARDLVAALSWESKTLATLAHPEGVPFRELLAAIGRARGRTTRTISIPSVLALAPLRVLEAAGRPLRFRSDSLLSLIHPNLAMDFSNHARLGLTYRRFLDEKLV